jgi:hypothetical protein
MDNEREQLATWIDHMRERLLFLSDKAREMEGRLTDSDNELEVIYLMTELEDLGEEMTEIVTALETAVEITESVRSKEYGQPSSEHDSVESQRQEDAGGHSVVEGGDGAVAGGGEAGLPVGHPGQDVASDPVGGSVLA